jgi:beta-glucanase (GH16 family)
MRTALCFLLGLGLCEYSRGTGYGGDPGKLRPGDVFTPPPGADLPPKDGSPLGTIGDSLGGTVIRLNYGNGGEPYSGQKPLLPGTIVASEFDKGGPGVSFNDVVKSSPGITTPDISNKAISFIGNGEWYSYTVAIVPGTYDVDFRLSSSNAGVAGFNVHLTLGNDCNDPEQSFASLERAAVKTGGDNLYDTFKAGRVTFQARPGMTGAKTSTEILRVCFMDPTHYVSFLSVSFGASVAADLPPGVSCGAYQGIPQTIPGLILAPLFNTGGEGVAYHDVPSAGASYVRAGETVTGSTSKVGWLQSGEWLKYSVEIKQGGNYDVNWMLAGNSDGLGHMDAELYLDQICDVGLPASQPVLKTLVNGFTTWSWDVFKPYNGGNIYLASGQYVITARFISTWWVDFQGVDFILTDAVSGPYLGKPTEIPGIIEAAKFDEGGVDVAYRDITTAKDAVKLRAGEGVTGYGVIVGWIEPGEWLKFTCSVAAEGTYSVTYNMAVNPPSTVKISMYLTLEEKCGGAAETKLGLIESDAFRTNNGWDAEAVPAAAKVSLPSGSHVLTLCFDQVSWAMFTSIDVMAVESAPLPSGSTPYKGVPMVVPGLIKAANFDDGADGVAYHDITTAKDAVKLRPGEGVTGYGETVGWIEPGEWLRFTCSIAAGTYSVTYNMAVNPPSTIKASMYLTLDEDCGGATSSRFAIISSDAFRTNNAWNAEAVPAAGTVALPGGSHVITLCFEQMSWALFSSIDIKTVAAPAPSPAPTPAPTPVPTPPAKTVSGAHAIPGFVPAAEFDDGGQNVAYYDLTTSLVAPQIRPPELVNGINGAITWIASGEWVRYTVNAVEGVYKTVYYVAGNPQSKPIDLELFLAVNSNGCQNTPWYSPLINADFNTYSGWEAVPAVAPDQIWIPGGESTITVCFNKASSLVFEGFELLHYDEPVLVATAFAPGIVEATAFTSYYDTTPDSGKELVYPTEGVEGTAGVKVNFVDNGEWLSYTVDAAGGYFGVSYLLSGDPAVAGCQVPIRLHMVIDSTDCAAPGVAYLDLADFSTGSWDIVQYYGAGDIQLAGGIHIITVCFEDTSWMDFHGISFGDPGSGWSSPQAQPCSDVPRTYEPLDIPANSPHDWWVYSWGDEFDEATLDGYMWISGGGWNGGWGNNELQSYQAGNVWIEDGKLVLFGEQKWSPDGAPYQSGKIASDTHEGFNVKFGRVEASINAPTGVGKWAAFWMMPGAYLGEIGVYGDWPASGEIDIMETVNDMTEVQHSLHYGGEGFWNKESSMEPIRPGFSYGNSYHEYAVEWAPWGEIKFFIDGVETASFNSWWTVGGGFPAPFDQPFHVIFNLAIGGDWPNIAGWPDDTLLPSKMYVDYVRVYQYNWLRRLEEGSTEMRGWDVPEGWDVETMSWKAGYEPRELKEASGLHSDCRPVSYFNGRPIVLSETGATLEAEHYDVGGEGCAYHDTSAEGSKKDGSNSSFRQDDSVDFMSYPDGAHGVYVTQFRESEWLTYTVDVPVSKQGYFAAQTYDVKVSMSSRKGGKFQIMLDTTDCSSSENVIFEESAVKQGKEEVWNTYSRVVMIPGGRHGLTVCVTSGNVNFDFMSFSMWTDTEIALHEGGKKSEPKLGGDFSANP